VESRADVADLVVIRVVIVVIDEFEVEKSGLVETLLPSCGFVLGDISPASTENGR
jgi:hypothetical protein